MVGRRRSKSSGRWILAWLAIALLATPSVATAQWQLPGRIPPGQQPRRGQAGVPGRVPGRFPAGGQMPRLEATGQVDAVAPGFIRMVASDGQIWTLRLAANARLRLRGAMEAQLIQSGQFIRFEGTVDHKTCEVEEKLEQITVFTPAQDNPDTQLGAFPVQPEGGGTPGDPFSQPQGGAPNPFSQPLGGVPGADQAAPAPTRPARTGGRASRRSRAGRGRKRGGPPPVVKAEYDIRGQIREIDRNGTLTVFVPNVFFRPAVKVNLADDVQVAVELAGPAVLGLTAKGDRIEARGVQIGPAVAEVAEVTIEKAEPIAPGDTRRTTPSRSARRTRARAPGADKAGPAHRRSHKRAQQAAGQADEQPGDASKGPGQHPPGDVPGTDAPEPENAPGKSAEAERPPG